MWLVGKIACVKKLLAFMNESHQTSQVAHFNMS